MSNYTTGTIDVVQGQATVSGINTDWATGLVEGGVLFVGGGSYPIKSVADDTSLTLEIPYAGATASNQSYAIQRFSEAAKVSVDNLTHLATLLSRIDLGVIDGNTIFHEGNLDKDDIGLGNVNNTADADKPVSTAQQNALDALSNSLQTNIDGKQPLLGFTPVDKAGDTMTGNLNLPAIITSARSTFKEANDGQIRLERTGSFAGAANLGANSENALMSHNASDSLVMKMSQNGFLTMPFQPYFMGAAVLADATTQRIDLTARVNVGGHYSAGVFTVPEDGTYSVYCAGVSDYTPAYNWLTVRLNGAVAEDAHFNNGGVATHANISLFFGRYLTQGQTIEIMQDNLNAAAVGIIQTIRAIIKKES